MTNKVKNTDVKKNYSYHFFSDIVNIKIFDPNNIQIYGKSWKKCSYLFLDMWLSKIQNT